MPTLYVNFLGGEEIAEGTMAFRFTRPPGFLFKSGQHIDVSIVSPPETDAEGNLRTFSVVSMPSDEYLMVATRMRDTAFKRILKTLPANHQVKIDGPFGSMTLHNDIAKPAVFLAGGIGITPFRSMVLDAAARNLPHKIFLFYSNRRPEDAPFLRELFEFEKGHPNFRFIPTMTDHELRGEWNGERGIINKEMMAKYIPDMKAPIYYLAGPPQMVESMREMLNSAGVDDDYIRSEEFAGY